MVSFHQAQEVQKRLKKLGNPEHAAVSQRFFKTGPGEYGDGDIFIGIRVPVLRRLVSVCTDLPVSEIEILLQSPIHEERLLAIFLFVRIFNKGDVDVKKDIYNLYLKSSEFINNWDLVDSSAEHIVGAYLMDKNKRPLYGLAKSKDLWERRIAQACCLPTGMI
jgi:3-methyladenine DNA glycosylase AlkD